MQEPRRPRARASGAEFLFGAVPGGEILKWAIFGAMLVFLLVSLLVYFRVGRDQPSNPALESSLIAVGLPWMHNTQTGLYELEPRPGESLSINPSPFTVSTIPTRFHPVDSKGRRIYVSGKTPARVFVYAYEGQFFLGLLQSSGAGGGSPADDETLKLFLGISEISSEPASGGE
jgi:hypothetical protein